MGGHSWASELIWAEQIPYGWAGGGSISFAVNGNEVNNSYLPTYHASSAG